MKSTLALALAILALAPGSAHAQAPAAPDKVTTGLAAAPLPEGAVLVTDDGMQAEYRDPRSPKAVARALQEAFAKAGDGRCAPGPGGAGGPLLVCSRTAMIDAETSDTVQVSVVSGGVGATRLLVEHAFGVVGKRHAPSDAHQIMAPTLPNHGAISPTQRALQAIPLKGEQARKPAPAAPAPAADKDAPATP